MITPTALFAGIAFSVVFYFGSATVHGVKAAAHFLRHPHTHSVAVAPKK